MDDTPTTLPLWLSLQAACKLVSRSEATLRRRGKAGAFKWRKDGKTRLIETRSLLAYFDQLPE